MHPPQICLTWPGKRVAGAPAIGRIRKMADGDPRFSVVQGDNATVLATLGERNDHKMTLIDFKIRRSSLGDSTQGFFGTATLRVVS